MPDDDATRSPSPRVAVVGALLAALLLWPLAEGVRGAFVDGHGRLTFAYVATVFRNPIYLEGLRNALAIAVFSTAIAGLLGIVRGAAAPPLRVSRAAPAGGAGAAAADGAAVRGRGRDEAAARPHRRAQRAARTAGAGRPERADRLAARRALRGGRRADRPAPLSDRLLQRAGGAGRPQRRDGGGGAQPRLPRPAPVPQGHAARDPAQRVRGRQHRLHLGVHRAGRAADVRLTSA